jgi:hypothetical protein
MRPLQNSVYRELRKAFVRFEMREQSIIAGCIQRSHKSGVPGSHCIITR